MSTTTQNEEAVHVSPLVEWLGDRQLALRWPHLLVCVWVATFFIYINNMPLFHTDLWGHVAYGHWILDAGELPQEDPFLSLADGMPVIASAWLSQIALAGADRLGGAEGLSGLFAVVTTSIYALLTWAFYLRTKRLGLAVAGATLVLMLGSTRMAVIRTEIFGGLALAVIVLAMSAIDAAFSIEQLENRSPWRRFWPALIAVPLLFVLWANAHGSFVVGLAIVGARVPGRLIDVWWKSRSLSVALTDQRFRFWLVLTEICFAATLLNPYGLDLLINAFMFPGNPNLAAVLEWKKLPLISIEGILWAFSWVLMLVVLRHSRHRIGAGEIVLLAVFNYSVVMSVRMIGWYAVVYAYFLLPHIAELLSRWVPLSQANKTADDSTSLFMKLRQPSLVYSAVCALVLWFGFAFSPMGNQILGGEPRRQAKVYSSATPRELTKYLREHPPQGRIWNPQWWGDWLVHDGPPNLQLFMTTNAVHVVPNQVWRDYLSVARANPRWPAILKKYRVSTIIVHKELQLGLDDRVRTQSGWEIVYEDDLAVVLTRHIDPDNESN